MIFVAKAEKYPKIKCGKYYVFPQHILFVQNAKICAVSHKKSKGRNPVDLFEEEFGKLGLSWESIVGIDEADIRMIISMIGQIEVVLRQTINMEDLDMVMQECWGPWCPYYSVIFSVLPKRVLDPLRMECTPEEWDRMISERSISGATARRLVHALSEEQVV